MPHAQPIDLRAEAGGGAYDNHPVAAVNDHVVRISTMTEHLHPDSDESFLVLEGRLRIEFADHAVELDPGQLYTVPRGVAHRTAPAGERSVNLTFEHRDAATIRVEAPT
ncbi:cupin domain-containing protein [Sphingomonas koreensis]|jgi:mannose-6-phosphate isomerase-like protein (cupin superfamily)|uniref:Cupin n=1 Tax=Sphingomonas koreensis TaxID=93064 RepID=A0A1L6J6L8_9SPHN|nr:cupin domain-containing protein [Sphingomonas koreensis]APR51456.1 cupin [Sphingomonas koreensis]MDC7811034.1 cupin domain-containing protein [Sphingomonas koreensis]RSU22657.1 cupin domain-containing protein [Sphingomonas koreensis]RSU27686.1 cupin domain-containing protein [Sphingomonas koreensis]RSU29196.1 cupin domain-containing protein [Sphingomonas koreensis]